jgi:large subunit ribosomal protein L35
MPKMKSHRGAAKRFKATASGRVKHKKPYHSHILTSKTTKRKRHLRQAAYAAGPEVKAIKRLLPYL